MLVTENKSFNGLRKISSSIEIVEKSISVPIDSIEENF